ncbi:MAG: putative metal-binding motif-containing protein [Alphaproteobacteria bacterium]|nr:putative metal-binding motif-containing protein [Alphaproteobacteria bacterium]
MSPSRALPLTLALLWACKDSSAPSETGLDGPGCEDPATWYADADGDGFGDVDSPSEPACEAPEGYAEADGDCDDGDANVNPDAAEACDGVDNDCDGLTDDADEDVQGGEAGWLDADGDGYGDPASEARWCEPPEGAVDNAEDCDDADAAVHPEAEEVCDGVDNDCDGLTDDEDEVDPEATATWYPDADSDGFGDASGPVESCSAPEGYVLDATDCDDAAAAVNPDATEVCNGIDDDCDADVDDADASLDSGTASTWYADGDGDSYGDAASAALACEQPSGSVSDASDCDDSDAAVNPGATEVCNGVDDDCDAAADDADASLDSSTATAWYDDADSDGYGDAAASTLSCEAPSGAVTDATDCDDADAAINPGEDEVCNGLDDDCDGLIDDADSDLDVATASTWYADSDGDGYGDASAVQLTCDQPSDGVTDDTDCDDSDASVNPGAAETWYDGTDSDCDGASDYDLDGDGDDSLDYGGTDCDDSDATRYGGVDCRPEASCTRPSAATLAASDPSGVTDMYFIGDCQAVVCTTISGTDYARIIDSSGEVATFRSTSNYNIGSCAADPSNGAIVVGYTSTQGIGYESGTSVPAIVTSGAGYLTAGNGPWANYYMNDSPGALAVDSGGSIWVPNWRSIGTLAEISTSGTVLNTWALGVGSLTSLDLDTGESVYVSAGDTIYMVDTSAGTATAWYVASDDILDFVFDYNDDIYVETTDDNVTWVDSSVYSEAVFLSSVTGDAKITISEDGYLFRMIGAPVGAASYEEYALSN